MSTAGGGSDKDLAGTHSGAQEHLWFGANWTKMTDRDEVMSLVTDLGAEKAGCSTRVDVLAANSCGQKFSP